MARDLAPVVTASNALTGRWVATFSSDADHLVSGYSAWHLLSILASGATGQAKVELAAVTDVDTAGGPAAINALFDELAADMASGLGIWVRPELELKQAFTELFPRMTIAPMPDDPGQLDDWLHESTGGILRRFPVAVTEDTRLLAATALGLDVTWKQRFSAGIADWPAPSGTWFAGLSRSEPTLDNGAILVGDTGTVSRYVCEADDNIDVHLVAGEVKDSAADVLRTGIDALAGGAIVESLGAMPVGTRYGCMTIERAPGSEDRLTVRLPAFHLEGNHDLTERARFFGLQAASDASGGHFDEIAAEPLAIEQVAQAAAADFTDTGFRAAAVTAAAVMAGSAMPTDTCTLTRFTFNRPFGMLAVHRPTNLILFAGWIATTAALRADGA